MVFRRVRNEINERIRVWVTLQRKLLRNVGRIELVNFLVYRNNCARDIDDNALITGISQILFGHAGSHRHGGREQHGKRENDVRRIQPERKR